MASQKYEEKFIKCPFFISENSNSLKCEGSLTEKQMYIFRSASEKKNYKLKFCKNRYCDCKNYKEVCEKYESSNDKY